LQQLPSDLAPGTNVDGFVVGEIVGRGSFSTVYLATHEDWMGRMIAFKVLHPGIQRRLKEGGRTQNPYAKEQMLCRRLNDAAVCRVLKVGSTRKGLYYAALEWADGDLLETHIKAHPNGMPMWEIAAVLGQLGRVVAEMHIQRVIHRDIKPANIILQHRGHASLNVKILDFGIAKLLDEDDGSTDPGEIMIGTPRYMSPEQAAGEMTRPRSDIFSMAAVAYEMATGKRHIQPARRGAEGYIEILLGVAPIPLEPITKLRPDLPEAAAAMISKGLSRDPDERPASVKAFLADILPHLQGRDFPPEPGLLQRTWHFLNKPVF
jgi:serine/threonine-protein kinase